jgi:hypothetical protein
MAAHFLTMNSSLQCAHGGTVTAATSNVRVKADGAYVLRSTDTFVVGGCPYMRGTQPNPCVRVRWDVHCERHDSDRDPSLTRDSVGLCLDASGGTQGTVVIASTQSKGAGL